MELASAGEVLKFSTLVLATTLGIHVHDVDPQTSKVVARSLCAHVHPAVLLCIVMHVRSNDLATANELVPCVVATVLPRGSPKLSLEACAPTCTPLCCCVSLCMSSFDSPNELVPCVAAAAHATATFARIFS